VPPCSGQISCLLISMVSVVIIAWTDPKLYKLCLSLKHPC